MKKSMREFIITLPFNDMEGFERVMRSYGDQIAAVITEPCQGNCAAITPREGFLELIRKKTEDHGCVFILDEELKPKELKIMQNTLKNEIGNPENEKDRIIEEILVRSLIEY